MEHKIDWELIRRYLDNSATQDDKKAFDDYLDASDENKLAFQRCQISLMQLMEMYLMQTLPIREGSKLLQMIRGQTFDC